ncbi:MAG: glutamate synthase central domain-containing protein, partial [Phormidesmis sp.]
MVPSNQPTSAARRTSIDHALDAPAKQGLYDPKHEHDACGVGFVVQMKGKTSHDIVQQGLTILLNLDHRGAVGAEPNTGDGAGILLQIPHGFMAKVAAAEGIELPAPGQYGVAMIYSSPDAAVRAEGRKKFEAVTAKVGLAVLGWRDVPTDNASLGPTAQASEPFMQQAFIGKGRLSDADEPTLERKLYVVRKLAHREIRGAGLKNFWYVTSMSCRTIVYKGMLMPEQVAKYYLDLNDPDMESALALVHSRFSTNTFPSWERSHPYRYIAHNGEINTLRGNINWMTARQSMFASELFGDDLDKAQPAINIDGSDSTIFDNTLELLTLSGRSLPHALMMMVPEPWSGHETMDAQKKAFYEYHSCLIEPWDGPASIAFTDGVQMGAVLDRNGLRPGRYYVTTDDRVIMASEAGVLPVRPEEVVQKGRLEPGKMFLVDTQAGRIIPDAEIKQQIAGAEPYQQWLDQHLVTLEQLPEAKALEAKALEAKAVTKRQIAFGYTFEELRMLLAPMGKDAVEAIGAMGTDTPLPVLSNRPKLLYNYFQQLFAQVTNPPIDSIREAIITSAITTIGSECNLLEPTPESCHLIQLKTPFITDSELANLKHNPQFKMAVLPILFDPDQGESGLAGAMEALCMKADEAIAQNHEILILSDRDIAHNRAPIPALLAVAGLHHHLIRNGTRTRVGIVLESGEPREVHHFAVLLGYGCGAINPYMAFETFQQMIDENLLRGVEYKEACKNYIKAATKGVVKIAAKIGISTIQSYRGAQIFEAIGLNQSVTDKYFTWTASRIQGVGLDVLAEEAIMRHRHAFPDRQPAGANNAATLEAGGEYQWRKDGEAHLLSPQSIHLLQKATREGDYALYKKYAALVNEQGKNFFRLRDLLDFQPQESVPIEEVESVEAIMSRFKTGAMSYGSISQEAHETLA